MREIHLNRGMVALVDDADYERIAAMGKWTAKRARRTFYAVKLTPRPERRTVYLHRLIAGLDAGDGRQVDHENESGLDCRRYNLRICSYGQNVQHRPGRSAGFKGVRRHHRGQRWFAQIVADGEVIYLGSHDTALNAALIYDAAARRYHGEFAYLNFPNGSPAVGAAAEPNTDVPGLQGHVSTIEHGAAKCLNPIGSESLAP